MIPRRNSRRGITPVVVIALLAVGVFGFMLFKDLFAGDGGPDAGPLGHFSMEKVGSEVGALIDDVGSEIGGLIGMGDKRAAKAQAVVRDPVERYASTIAGPTPARPTR